MTARLSSMGAAMKYDPITSAQPILDQSVASDCGELAVGCSEAAGRIKRATDQMDRQIAELGRLEDYVAGLEADQRQIADSTDEAKLLRSEEHTSELQSLMRISYAVFCLKKKKQTTK